MQSFHKRHRKGKFSSWQIFENNSTFHEKKIKENKMLEQWYTWYKVKYVLKYWFLRKTWEIWLQISQYPWSLGSGDVRLKHTIFLVFSLIGKIPCVLAKFPFSLCWQGFLCAISLFSLCSGDAGLGRVRYLALGSFWNLIHMTSVNSSHGYSSRILYSWMAP